jgi:tRNA(Ile)-lysidine synthase
VQELSGSASTKPKKAAKPALPEEPLDRFNRALMAMAKDEEMIGVAVSGGPDSLALLLLASAARPGKVEAATVDHGLRDGSREEAEMVAALCKTLGVPHEILTVEWEERPDSAIQQRARIRRYKELASWATRRGIGLLATAHHADDQAETLLMRLVRGSGVRGLGAIRALRKLPGTNIMLARPLLRWTRSELADICAKAGVEPAQDPSNSDLRFERVRVREMLAGSDWLDPAGLARSATHLAQADEALNWAARKEWHKRVKEENAVVTFDPAGLPSEIRRRLVAAIVSKLTSEGRGVELRGRELDRLMAALVQGRKSTLRGVLCGGGGSWRFARAPQRKTRPAPDPKV